MNTHEVDRYWADVLDRKNALGQLKYCTLSKVVRAALAVSHGNSDAERSFSANKRTVTPERSSLNEETISALRMVKDAIRLFGEGHAFNIPVTDALRHSARAAHQKYKEAQEKKRQEELEMTRKKIIEQNQREQEVAEEKERARVQEAKAQAIQEIREQETKLLTIEKEQHNVLKSAQVLICDSESKLADAIKHGDMDQVSVAHGLLEIARKRTATATTELRVVAQKRQKCADKLKLQTDTASQIATDKKPKRH